MTHEDRQAVIAEIIENLRLLGLVSKEGNECTPEEPKDFRPISLRTA